LNATRRLFSSGVKPGPVDGLFLGSTRARCGTLDVLCLAGRAPSGHEGLYDYARWLAASGRAIWRIGLPFVSNCRQPLGCSSGGKAIGPRDPVGISGLCAPRDESSIESGDNQQGGNSPSQSDGPLNRDEDRRDGDRSDVDSETREPSHPQDNGSSSKRNESHGENISSAERERS
jgi:hypothetical protein